MQKMDIQKENKNINAFIILLNVNSTIVFTEQISAPSQAFRISILLLTCNVPVRFCSLLA